MSSQSRTQIKFTIETFDGQTGETCIPARRGSVCEAFFHKARDRGLSQAALQGVEHSSGGKFVSMAYFRCGSTMEQYSGIKVALDSSENEQRTIKSNCLPVFAASLQCTKDVVVVAVCEVWEIYWRRKALMALRVRHTPTRSPTKISCTPVDSTPLHSMPEV